MSEAPVDGCAWAHTPNRVGRWHPLEEHLAAVADRAERFAEPFRAGEAAHLAGLWHDVGKFDPAFQAYLIDASAGRAASRGPDHKGAGAGLAIASGAEPLAFLIAGHHGGMHDRDDLRAWVTEHAAATGAQTALAAAQMAMRLDPVPFRLPPGVDRPQAADVLLRLLFSAVVDADFLDTEAHFDPDRPARRRPTSTMEELSCRAARAHERLLLSRAAGGRVNAVRDEVFASCLEAASLAPGFFRLTVPTGGGKTLSGLSFALRHACLHELRRVVVAIPFTSITEQTADVYRGACGGHAVLEHHSALDPVRTGQLDPKSRLWMRLAAENWDAPLVVTTAVQLFESLFSNRPSASRKVHRLAKSVLILDEAQTLPPGILDVTLDALAALVLTAGTTVVFSTATQPAFDPVAHAAIAGAREIVPSHESHFAALRRVRYEVPARTIRWDWDRVASEMLGSSRALAIVNRRRDALALLSRLPDDTLHLSTLLCGAHRRRVLAEVRRRLRGKTACRVVATQVVEAGVDVDFPLVLRALAPFDSVIQAAGRCNREDRVAEGRCVVFRPQEEDTAPGPYRAGRDECAAMLAEGDVAFDRPADCARYFARLFQSVDTDRGGLRQLRDNFRFETLARAYHVIDDDSEQVIVPYGSAGRIATLVAMASDSGDPGRSRRVLRLLQPFTVALRQRDIERAAAVSWINRTATGLAVWTAKYDDRTGVGALLLREKEET